MKIVWVFSLSIYWIWMKNKMEFISNEILYIHLLKSSSNVFCIMKISFWKIFSTLYCFKRKKKENSNEARICTSVFYWIRNFMKRWATTTKIPQMTENIKIIWRYTLNKNSHHWICYMEQYNGGCYIEMFAFQKWYRHRISYLI